MKNSRNDVAEKISIGQPDTSDTVKTNDTLSYTYQDLNGECEEEKKKFLDILGKKAHIKNIFMCGRKSEDDSFIACGNSHIADSFVVKVTYRFSKEKGSGELEMMIDSKGVSQNMDNIRSIFLFTIGVRALIVLKSFSGNERIFRVGIDCLATAIIFDYAMESSIYLPVAYRKTYVGYNSKEIWKYRYFDGDLEHILPKTLNFDNLIEQMMMFEE